MAQAREFRRVLFLGVGVAVLLSGCGGSGSSTTTVTGGDPGAISSGSNDFKGTVVREYFTGDNATLKAGAFFGELSYLNDNPPPVEGLMLLSATGNYTFILDTDANDLRANVVTGTLTLVDAAIEGFAVEYELTDEAWIRSTGSIAGIVSSNDSALLNSGGIVVKTELIRQNLASDQNLDFQLMAGTYETTGADPQMMVDVDGGINGVDRGCIIQGKVSIPDPEISIFELSYNASGCTDLAGEATGSQRDGDYQGVGTFTSADAGGAVEFAASNGKIAFYFAGTR